MEILIVNQSEVKELLPMDACINVMEEALKTLGRGDGVNPLRIPMWLPDKRGLLAIMHGQLGGEYNMMGVKLVSIMPGNHGTEYDSHMGLVTLFETTHGRPLAVIDGSSITAIRTAAASGVATKLLAKAAASDLAILGSGAQAITHLDAMLHVRDIKRVRVWSRTAENVQKFAAAYEEKHGITIEAMPSAQAAVEGADIICTATSSREPVLMGDWIAPGAHINAVGSSVKHARELDTAAMVKSRLYIDRLESTLNEAGDFLIPKEEGAVGDDHIIGEIGDILLGKLTGRESDDEITVFKSLGIAAEDIASAYFVYQQALEKGLGTSVEFGGEPFA
jgi:ornithine cyclodeaminase/alanine dehydrogenase-like protein (mu-crystallin family)